MTSKPLNQLVIMIQVAAEFVIIIAMKMVMTFNCANMEQITVGVVIASTTRRVSIPIITFFFLIQMSR